MGVIVIGSVLSGKIITDYQDLWGRDVPYGFVKAPVMWEEAGKFPKITGLFKPTTMRGGIFSMIPDTPSEVPAKLTLEHLQTVITKVFSQPTTRKMPVIYTGRTGWETYNWVVTFGDTLHCKYYSSKFKNSRGTYISLFQKHGLYKIRVFGSTFQFFKGTQKIHEIHNVRSQWHMIDAMSNVKQTHEKIDEVNRFINTLK